MKSKLTDRKRKSCQVVPIYKSPAIQSNILNLPNGYWTQPSLRHIVSEQFIVPSFRVSNGKTSIEWKGPMDLRKHIPTTLAELIDLGDDFVQVYRNGAHTPRIGQGFNRQCVATFTNGREYALKCKSYSRLLKGLGKLCKLNHCQLVSFDIETGVWQIKIQHFTKLKFEVGELDSDESDEERKQPTIMAPAPSMQTVPSAMAFHQEEIFMELDEPLKPDVFSKKVVMTDLLYREVGNFNKEVTKQKGIVSKWWQLRNGGSGMKFSIQRGRRGFKVTASTKQQSQSAELPHLIRYGLAVDSLPALIRSDASNKFKYTLVLLHILFTRTIQNAIKDGRVVTADSHFTFKEALKSWFQTKTATGTYTGEDPILKALSRRNTDDLVNQLIKQSQYNLAEVVTKLEDPLFRQMYVVPNDCRGVLQQILMGVFTLLPGQTWVDALAICLWYGNETNFPQIVLKVCEWFKEPNDEQELRLLKLYSLKKQQEKNQNSMTIFDSTVRSDVLNWAISNILSEVETDVTKEAVWSQRRYRQVFSLMSKLTYDDFTKILRTDNFLKGKQGILRLYFKRLVPERYNKIQQPVSLLSTIIKGQEGYLSATQKKSLFDSLQHTTDQRAQNVRQYLGVDLGLLMLQDHNIERLMKLAENTTKRQQQNIMECIVRRMKQNESNFRALLNLNDVLAERLSKLAKLLRNPAIRSYIDILRL